MIRTSITLVVEEAQCLGVEFSGGRGDDRHEPVVLSLKPLMVLGHLGAVGLVECLLVAGVLRAIQNSLNPSYTAVVQQPPALVKN